MITDKETQTIVNAINILLREVKTECGELINPIIDFAKNLNVNVETDDDMKKNIASDWKEELRFYNYDPHCGPCTQWNGNKYWCKCFTYLKKHPYSTRNEVHRAVTGREMRSTGDHSTSWRSMLSSGVVKMWRNKNNGKIAYTIGTLAE